MNSQTGKFIIFFGILIVIIGLIIYFFGSKLGWIGKLPGDIRVEKENFKFYAPITSMILLSIVGSILWRLIARFLN